jgi:hypothetical protein
LPCYFCHLCTFKENLESSHEELVLPEITSGQKGLVESVLQFFLNTVLSRSECCNDIDVRQFLELGELGSVRELGSAASSQLINATVMDRAVGLGSNTTACMIDSLHASRMHALKRANLDGISASPDLAANIIGMFWRRRMQQKQLLQIHKYQPHAQRVVQPLGVLHMRLVRVQGVADKIFGCNLLLGSEHRRTKVYNSSDELCDSDCSFNVHDPSSSLVIQVFSLTPKSVVDAVRDHIGHSSSQQQSEQEKTRQLYKQSNMIGRIVVPMQSLINAADPFNTAHTHTSREHGWSNMLEGWVLGSNRGQLWSWAGERVRKGRSIVLRHSGAMALCTNTQQHFICGSYTLRAGGSFSVDIVFKQRNKNGSSKRCFLGVVRECWLPSCASENTNSVCTKGMWGVWNNGDVSVDGAEHPIGFTYKPNDRITLHVDMHKGILRIEHPDRSSDPACIPIPKDELRVVACPGNNDGDSVSFVPRLQKQWCKILPFKGEVEKDSYMSKCHVGELQEGDGGSTDPSLPGLGFVQLGLKLVLQQPLLKWYVAPTQRIQTNQDHFCVKPVPITKESTFSIKELGYIQDQTRRITEAIARLCRIMEQPPHWVMAMKLLFSWKPLPLDNLPAHTADAQLVSLQV